jgi:hypothetical protein
MEVKVFLVERKIENMKKIEDRSPLYRDTFDKCWEMVESCMVKNHERVTSKFVRRLEILEALIFGFLESSSDLNSLDFAEKTIYALGRS